MHPYHTLLLNSPVSPLNAPVVGYHPLYGLLMIIPPSDEQEDVAAIFGSTLCVMLPWYMQIPEEAGEDLAAIAGSTIGILLAHYTEST